MVNANLPKDRTAMVVTYANLPKERTTMVVASIDQRQAPPVPFDEPQYVSRRTKQFQESKHASELFQLVLNNSWKDATFRVINNPAEASQWIVKPNCDESEWHRLPIHEACIRNPTLEFVEALLDAYPSGVREPDHNGRLPIHHACCHGADLAVVDKLAVVYPGSLDVADVWGKVPLSVAKATITPHRDSLIEVVSKGKDFYVEKQLKLKWLQEVEDSSMLLEYQMKIKTQQETIALLEQNARQERIRLEEENRRQKEIIARLEKEMKEAKKKAAGCSDALKIDLASSQIRINELNCTVQEKTGRIGVLEGRLVDLNVDLDREVSINDGIKRALSAKEKEICSLRDQLQQERERNESLAASKSELESSTRSLNAQLKFSLADNAKLWKDLVVGRLERDAMAKKLADKVASEDSLKDHSEFLRGEQNALRGTSEELEENLGNAQEKIASLQNELEAARNLTPRLEADIDALTQKLKVSEIAYNSLKEKTSSLEEIVASVPGDDNVLTAQLAEQKDIHSTATTTEVETLRCALAEEREANQAIRQELEDSKRKCGQLDKIIAKLVNKKVEELQSSLGKQAADSRLHHDIAIKALQKEKSEMEFKIYNLEATIRHMKKEREEEEKARSLKFSSLEAAMKKSGEEHSKLLCVVTELGLNGGRQHVDTSSCPGGRGSPCSLSG